MILNEQTVNVYKEILENPAKFGTPHIRPLAQCFKEADKPTPKHILYKQLAVEMPNLPKVIFYIIADEKFKIGKAENGDLGYYVTYVEPISTPNPYECDATDGE